MIQIFHEIIGISPPFNMIVLIVLLTAGASVIKVVAMQVRRYFVHRHELEFKRELIDRGLSGDEIERVIRAHGPSVEK